MAEKKRYPNPEFKSLEEERKYWEERSPLMQGYRGRVQRASQRRSSYFALRLSGEEITRLRDAAARADMSLSAYARRVLMSAVEKGSETSKALTLEEFGQLVEQRLPAEMKEQIISLVRAISIGNPEKPTLLLIDASQMKVWEELAKLFLPLLLSMAGVKVVSPQSKEYPALREVVKS